MHAEQKRIALFASLSDEDLRTLADHVVLRTFPKNSVIINEGEDTDALYFILSGRVKIFLSDVEGREIELGTEEAGGYFGEMVLDGGPRSASVMTLLPSRFATIRREAFEQFMLAHPAVALELLRKLICRTRAATASVRSLALLDVYGRVVRLLLDLAHEQDGKLVIAGKLTQQDIANRVSASREMTGRILRDLAAGGYIEIEPGRVTILKKPPPGW